MKINLYRIILERLTGDALRKSERQDYDRWEEVYEDDLVDLYPSEFRKFRRLWKIDKKYNSDE